MEMTGLQIFKYLPAAKKADNTNCQKCGCPTCMAFALKLAKQNIEISKCPYAPEELIINYSQSIKHPQKTIQIANLKIGGENVLYRHEKTFVNRTTLAILVDCEKPDYEEIIEDINNFELKSVNEILKVDLIILKNKQDQLINSQIPFITEEELHKLNLRIFTDIDFKQTKQTLITTREKAILEKNDEFSDPVCVILPMQDKFELCAKASYYICKYANMLIFEDFDPEIFSTLLTLRLNIYTDPQKPLQVESGLYEYNTPDKDSIVFLTTNFALTFFAVSNELENLSESSYLIVIPADGMSVLTAWSAEKFTAEIVAKTLTQLNIREKIATRKIIIPGLLAHTIEELKEEIPDFEFVIGTNEAVDISEFVKKITTVHE